MIKTCDFATDVPDSSDEHSDGFEDEPDLVNPFALDVRKNDESTLRKSPTSDRDDASALFGRVYF
jgi:hypothetical protein